MAALNPPIQLADAEIFHSRIAQNGLRFRYRVLALVADIDRLDEAHGLPFFSVDQINILGFNRRDHGARDGSSLRGYIDQLHRQAGLEPPASIMLICFPRILGFVFNPLAIYSCRNIAGTVTSIAYEVRNTFGGQHTYLIPVVETADGTIIPHECDKAFYVSPFMDMALRYRFLIAPPRDGAFSVRIIERDAHGVVLTALMKTRAFSPTRKAILARLAATPHLGFKVLAAIHWQALRLWFRGHKVRTRPTSTSTGATFSVPVAPSTVRGEHHV